MHKGTILLAGALAAMMPFNSAMAQPSAKATTHSMANHFTVDGLELFYETHGSGPPIVLLHGGIAASDAFGANLTLLAKSHSVITPHMQGHGHTKDLDRPLRYERMADDVAALIRHLKLGKVDVVGYSMGGGVALQTAIRHPELVDQLVVISTTMSRDGWYPDVVKAFADMPSQSAALGASLGKSPLAKLYPNVKWDGLFRKIGAMESEPFDWQMDVAKIGSPTLLIFADADAVRPEHIVDMYQQFGGFIRDGGVDGSKRPASRLAIIPNTTHYNLLQTTSVAELTADFLRK